MAGPRRSRRVEDARRAPPRTASPQGGAWAPGSRLDLQQLVGSGEGVELACGHLPHEPVELLAAAALLCSRSEPLVHDRAQLVSQPRPAPSLQAAVGLEVRAVGENRAPQVADTAAVG